MQTGAMVHLSSNGFVDAFVSAAVGESFVYATGDLSFERHRAIRMAKDFSGVELDAMADLAYATL